VKTSAVCLMNSRTVSLPDLVSGKKRNSALSLSEGFAGADHEGALGATAQNWPSRSLGSSAADSRGSQLLGKVVPLYYRTRQLVLSTEKGGHRVPAKLQTELRFHEKALSREIRAVHPLLFQRFDDPQLDRLLRAMPFMKLSQGRWIMGNEDLGAEWPSARGGQRAFLILSGRVAAFSDSSGQGQRTELFRGQIFGSRHFQVGEEALQGFGCGAARCEEACIVAVLETSVLEAAYADRAFGNPRIAQLVKHVPALARIVQAEKDLAATTANKESSSNAVAHALQDLSRVASTLHVRPGEEILSSEPLEESVIIVSSGTLAVRGDVTLTEKLEAMPRRRIRVQVEIEKATNLAGDSVFDKLDPYCVVKLGDFKRLQTAVLWNAGPNPKFEYSGYLTYSEEQELEFIVMDHNKISADEPCGGGSLNISELPDGWSGTVNLFRQKRGIFMSDSTQEEAAGTLFVTIRWDYEKVTSQTRKPKEKSWEDLELFTLKENHCWGHEPLMLGSMFLRTLEQASTGLSFAISFSRFRVIGSADRGASENACCWKISRHRFMDFVKHCGRQNHFLQACRVSSLEKQGKIREIMVRLIRKWEIEEATAIMRNPALLDEPPAEEAPDPNDFRRLYRGCKAHISVRNALNLSGGGFFDKLDPYAIAQFRGSREKFWTSTLHDAGNDPVWDCEGTLTYQGEAALEISVWDWNKTQHELLATGVLQVNQFCGVGGFDGMVRLSLPKNKQNKTLKQSMIIIGIQFDPPPNPSLTLNASTSLTGLKSLMQGS